VTAPSSAAAVDPVGGEKKGLRTLLTVVKDRAGLRCDNLVGLLNSRDFSGPGAKYHVRNIILTPLTVGFLTFKGFTIVAVFSFFVVRLLKRQ
jgi:hypothetical protein